VAGPRGDGAPNLLRPAGQDELHLHPALSSSVLSDWHYLSSPVGEWRGRRRRLEATRTVCSAAQRDGGGVPSSSCTAVSQLRPSKGRIVRLETSAPSTQRTLMSRLSGCERAT